MRKSNAPHLARLPRERYLSMQIPNCFFSICSAIALFMGSAITTSGATAGTLDDIRARDKLICGVSEGLPGFSEKDGSGSWHGFDVDFCKAVAAAVLGDNKKVEYVPLSADTRFDALKDRRIDLLSRNSTWTMSRDLELGIDFVGVSYFDGQGFLVPTLFGATSPLQLDGAKICVVTGTTSETNAANYFQKHKLKVSFLRFTERADARAAYAAEKCDAFTGDRSALAAERSLLPKPQDHVILRDVISKEPLGPVTREDNPAWTGLVRWTLFALINAEELGLHSASVTTSQRQQAVALGTPAAKALGLSSEWLVAVIGGVGNYAEMFEPQPRAKIRHWNSSRHECAVDPGRPDLCAANAVSWLLTRACSGSLRSRIAARAFAFFVPFLLSLTLQVSNARAQLVNSLRDLAQYSKSTFSICWRASRGCRSQSSQRREALRAYYQEFGGELLWLGEQTAPTNVISRLKNAEARRPRLERLSQQATCGPQRRRRTVNRHARHWRSPSCIFRRRFWNTRPPSRSADFCRARSIPTFSSRAAPSIRLSALKELAGVAKVRIAFFDRWQPANPRYAGLREASGQLPETGRQGRVGHDSVGPIRSSPARADPRVPAIRARLVRDGRRQRHSPFIRHASLRQCTGRSRQALSGASGSRSRWRRREDDNYRHERPDPGAHQKHHRSDGALAVDAGGPWATIPHREHRRLRTAPREGGRG